MVVKRRHVLECGSIALLSLFGGCSAPLTTTETPTETTQPLIVTRLLGPDTDYELFSQSDIASVRSVREYSAQFSVPVALTDEAATDVKDVFNSAGVTGNTTAFDVVVFEGDQEITRFGISPGLASEISNGEWNGELQLQFDQRTTAETVRTRLVCGADSNACGAD